MRIPRYIASGQAPAATVDPNLAAAKSKIVGGVALQASQAFKEWGEAREKAKATQELVTGETQAIREYQDFAQQMAKSPMTGEDGKPSHSTIDVRHDEFSKKLKDRLLQNAETKSGKELLSQRLDDLYLRSRGQVIQWQTKRETEVIQAQSFAANDTLIEIANFVAAENHIGALWEAGIISLDQKNARESFIGKRKANWVKDTVDAETEAVTEDYYAAGLAGEEVDLDNIVNQPFLEALQGWEEAGVDLSAEEIEKLQKKMRQEAVKSYILGALYREDHAGRGEEYVNSILTGTAKESEAAEENFRTPESWAKMLSALRSVNIDNREIRNSLKKKQSDAEAKEKEDARMEWHISFDKGGMSEQDVRDAEKAGLLSKEEVPRYVAELTTRSRKLEEMQMMVDQVDFAIANNISLDYTKKESQDGADAWLARHVGKEGVFGDAGTSAVVTMAEQINFVPPAVVSILRANVGQEERAAWGANLVSHLKERAPSAYDRLSEDIKAFYGYIDDIRDSGTPIAKAVDLHVQRQTRSERQLEELDKKYRSLVSGSRNNRIHLEGLNLVPWTDPDVMSRMAADYEILVRTYFDYHEDIKLAREQAQADLRWGATKVNGEREFVKYPLEEVGPWAVDEWNKIKKEGWELVSDVDTIMTGGRSWGIVKVDEYGTPFPVFEDGTTGDKEPEDRVVYESTEEWVKAQRKMPQVVRFEPDYEMHNALVKALKKADDEEEGIALDKGKADRKARNRREARRGGTSSKDTQVKTTVRMEGDKFTAFAPRTVGEPN